MYKEICCAEGEAMLYYIHACIEKEMLDKIGRKGEPLSLTIGLLNKRLLLVIEEQREHVQVILDWVIKST